MTLTDMIAVLQAARDNKAIECRLRPGMAGPPWPEWGPANHLIGTKDFNFKEYDYRVKPEPREWWASIDSCGHPETLFISRDAAAHCSSKDFQPIRVREVIE